MSVHDWRARNNTRLFAPTAAFPSPFTAELSKIANSKRVVLLCRRAISLRMNLRTDKKDFVQFIFLIDLWLKTKKEVDAVSHCEKKY